MLKALKEFVGIKPRSYTLSVPRIEENEGLLLLGAGDSAIRFCPPLCISAEQVETALQILGGILANRKPEKLAV